MYREVEVKYPLKNPDHVREVLTKLEAKSTSKAQTQEDTYYVPAHRNFLEPDIVSEWLRIRITPKKCSINYKLWLPFGSEKPTHCDEYETEVENPEALEMILMSLNMTKIVTVKKERSTWLYKDIEIALDTVEGLGTFIELEGKSDSEDVSAVYEVLQKMKDILEADTLEQDYRGYPYQLLHRSK